MKMITQAVLASALLALPAFAAEKAAAAPEAKASRVSFVTADNWTLYGDYLPAKPGMPTVIMVHGLGSSRGEWKVLEDRLAPKGAGYLSIDMRCHGESVKNPQGKTESNWMSCLQNSADIKGAWDYLTAHKVKPADIYAAGASIGANLVLAASAEGGITPAGILLFSPGLDYRGIKTGKAIEKTGRLPVFMAAAYSDGYALHSVGALNKTALAQGHIPEVVIAQEGHGVNMLSGNPDAAMVLERTEAFIMRNVKAAPAQTKPAKKL